MIERLRQIWLPAAGSISSISLSAAENVKNTTATFITPTQVFISEHPLMYYFLIGFAGALGGLIVKIIWGLIKRRFECLENIG